MCYLRKYLLKTFPYNIFSKINKITVPDFPLTYFNQGYISGAVAHPGERFNGIEEVGGSSPPSSTKFFYFFIKRIYIYLSIESYMVYSSIEEYIISKIDVRKFNEC